MRVAFAGASPLPSSSGSNARFLVSFFAREAAGGLGTSAPPFSAFMCPCSCRLRMSLLANPFWQNEQTKALETLHKERR